jgi:hypothetical protein
VFLLCKRFSGKRMRELRKKRYPRIEPWAIALDRSFRMIQSYESGNPPPVHVLERAAELLKVDPGKFFVDDGE